MNKSKAIATVLLVLLVVLYLGFTQSIKTYSYDSAESCYSSEYKVEKLLYIYENDNNGFANFSTKGMFFFSYFKKRNIFGKTKYKNVIIKSVVPATHFKEWTKISDDLYIRYVKYKDDIKEIEANGYTYECAYIEDEIGKGESNPFWIYVIDTSKEENQNLAPIENYRSFNYKKDISLNIGQRIGLGWYRGGSLSHKKKYSLWLLSNRQHL